MQDGWSVSDTHRRWAVGIGALRLQPPDTQSFEIFPFVPAAGSGQALSAVEGLPSFFLTILREAAATGASTDQISAQQNASSGMWAFGESLEVIFLEVFFYLLWPACFNAAARLLRPKAAAKAAC